MFFNFSFTRLFSFCLPPCVICRTMIATQQDCVYIRDVKDGMVQSQSCLHQLLFNLNLSCKVLICFFLGEEGGVVASSITTG